MRLMAVLKVLRAKQPGEVLRSRILANLAGQAQPEFTDVCLLRGPAEIDARMPLWMSAFLSHIWGRAGR